MAKYIGTYATSGDVQTALNESELSRPFIAYTTDDDKVIFGPNVDIAEVGDIVVYSTGDTLLHYIKQADYSASTYPTAAYIPVGVVAMPQADDVISGPSGEITFMGLNWLSKTSPDSGQPTDQAMEWGYSNFDIPELTNCSSTGTAITDMNGKANTQAVLNYATAQTNWRTASAITWTNAAGYYPVFECAWRYHTSGTAQGDWYVPACGQLINFWRDDELAEIFSAGFVLVGARAFSKGTNQGTSSEYNYAKGWNFYGGRLGNSDNKDTGWARCRPYCTMLMTRI